ASVLASALSQRDPVLPMRFGILLPDQAAVAAELLEPSRPELETLLERFAGTVELELKALYPDQQAVLAEVVRADPRSAGLRGRGPARRPRKPAAAARDAAGVARARRDRHGGVRTGRRGSPGATRRARGAAGADPRGGGLAMAATGGDARAKRAQARSERRAR